MPYEAMLILQTNVRGGDMHTLWAKFQRKYKLLAAAFLVIGVSGGAAIGVMAAIPDTNGVIHGCYRTSSGILRVVDSPTQACNSNETAINWQQNGAQALSNELALPSGQAANQVLLSIPNFGEVRVASCGTDPDGGFARSLLFVNTTANVLRGTLLSQGGIPGYDVQPGQSIEFGSSPTANTQGAVFDLLLTSSTGNQKHSLRLAMQAETIQANTCNFLVQGITQ